MKKVLAVLMSCFLFSSLAIAAGNSGALMKQVDQKISESKQLSPEELQEIKSLRVQAEDTLKSGNEEESEEMLKEALALLG